MAYQGGRLTPVRSTGHVPVAVTTLRNFSWASVAPASQPELWACLARDCVWRASITWHAYCLWVLWMLLLMWYSDVFPVSLYMLLPYPVLVLAPCSSNLIQDFMILKAEVWRHLFAQASNCAPCTLTIFRHFWRDLKCHLNVCLWILFFLSAVGWHFNIPKRSISRKKPYKQLDIVSKWEVNVNKPGSIGCLCSFLCL